MYGNRTGAARAAPFLTLALGLGVPALGGELLISIPPGAATRTLNEWSYQTGFQVLFDFRVVHGVRTHGVAGTWRPLDALAAMLRDTGITYDPTDNRTVAVIPGTLSGYCLPELGALAPLPPCRPLPRGQTL